MSDSTCQRSILHSPKTARVAIHLHPSFEYLVQACVTAEKLLGHNNIEFYFLLSPILQKHHVLQDFLSFLNTNAGALKPLLGQHVHISQISRLQILANLPSALHKLLLGRRTLVTKKAIVSLSYASKDSIMRKPLSLIYFLSPRPVRYLFEALHLIWATAFQLTYTHKLSSAQCDLVVASHATYIPYVALIEASLSCNTQVLVHDVYKSFLLKAQSSTYHSNRFLYEATQSLDHRSLLTVTSNTYVDPTSPFAETTSDTEKPSSQHNSQFHDKRTLIIATHCFKDCNHNCDPSAMLFDNYFDWTLYTSICLSLLSTDFDYVVYKIHPHATQYRDKTLLLLIGLLLKVGVNRRKVFIEGRSSAAESPASIYQQSIPTTVSFHGSIINESAINGKGSISAGLAPAADNSFILPLTQASYQKLLIHSKLSSHLTCLDKQTVFAAQNLRKVQSLMNLNGVLSNYSYGDSFRSLYFFGSSGPLDHNKFKQLISSYKDAFNLTTINVNPTIIPIAYSMNAT